MKYPVPVTDRGMKMDIYSGVLWIVGVLAAVLMIGAFKSRTEMVVNFILRGVLGMLIFIPLLSTVYVLLREDVDKKNHEGLREKAAASPPQAPPDHPVKSNRQIQKD